jgi:hypothetical protein
VKEGKEINPEDFKIEITSPEQYLAVRELYRLLDNKIRVLEGKVRVLEGRLRSLIKARKYLFKAGVDYNMRRLETNLQRFYSKYELVTIKIPRELLNSLKEENIKKLGYNDTKEFIEDAIKKALRVY